MALSKREKILASLVVGVFAMWLVVQYGVLRIYGALSMRAETLTTTRKTFTEYDKKMKKGVGIRQRYEEIAGRYASVDTEKKSDPRKDFSEFVANLCRRLGFNYPNIEPPKIEPIEEVDDYSFITLAVHTRGDREKVAKLLKGFDAEAVLIRQLDIRARLDNPVLDVTLTVARMVKMKPAKKTKGLSRTLRARRATFPRHTRRRAIAPSQR